jgi:hypothetical protein
MDKLTKAERDALSAIGKRGGKSGSRKLSKAQRKERARLAGIASGKARRKKAGKK